MKKQGLKTYSLKEITDKFIGKNGTPKREPFENELRLDLLGAAIKQAHIHIESIRDFHELSKLNETVQTWHHENYPDEFKPFDINEIENAFEQMFQNENVFAFKAILKDKSVGYLLGYFKTRQDSAFQYEKTVCYIDQVAVLPEYQKLGVGQLLMDKVYELSNTKRITEVQLDFWSDNHLAENFFLRNGFIDFNKRMKKGL